MVGCLTKFGGTETDTANASSLNSWNPRTRLAQLCAIYAVLY
ncbi:MAG: hypothetical protein RMY34_16050 [Aulosira sp. DedQUE10]|nr:hypothetical protein [Aulosira sp. DedQUE10]